MRITVESVIGRGFSLELEVPPESTVSMVKYRLASEVSLDPKDFLLVRGGNVLDEGDCIGEPDMAEGGLISPVPENIAAGVDEGALMEEYRFLREQFPLVRMIDLMTYVGKLRVDRGYVKELAEKNIWPFTEYVKWHEFKMVLSYLHPYKPPTVTWLTDISHPNIIPQKKGKVCVSILGKKWLPNTKLAAVVNALYFLLSDPNPYSAYPNKRCQEVAKICRMFGFPLKRVQSTARAGGPEP